MASKPTKTVLTGHTAGIFADMTLDGPEIGTLVAVVDRAKNLPNRRTMGKQDPYCAMRLGKEAKKTDTDRRGGQTPKWDQELRFTIHDSPDYYRLKCSVFNDDKKTDLIGEAWISLVELIKPGGGSNDLWHQLNYKGKYAGDIRVELTYYDRRPREEKSSEKKKSREKASVANGDVGNASAAPRQLGPREVRRRPLPASPAAGTPATQSPAQTPPALPEQEPPARPPKLPIDHDERLYNPTLVERHEEPQPIPTMLESTPPAQLSLQHYRQPFCEDQSSSVDYPDETSWNVPYDERPQYHHSPSSSMVPSPSSLPPSWSGETEQWTHGDSQRSQQYPDSDVDDFGMSRALTASSGQPAEPYYHSTRSNTSPVKPTPYRDSPLRHSINHDDFGMQHFHEPDSYDAPPPPPPMHRDTPPRRRPQEYPPSSFPHQEQSVVPFDAQHFNPATRRVSFDERSPLQQIERQYSTQPRPDPAFHQQIERRLSHDSYRESEPNQYEDYPPHDYRTPERHHSYDPYQGQDYSSSNAGTYRQENFNGSPHEQSRQRPTHRGRRSSYDDRRSSGNPTSFEEQYAMVPHSNTQLDLSQAGYHRPEPIRPKPQSSSSNQKVPRKEVSPEPFTAQDGRRLSAVPFGPDAYDVLNPASSPVTNDGTMFQTPQQAKESARMKEVEKLRDQGPIIGNDGRVIDPSDHLPSDTWAPEPERKQRRPEHVIHYRTKNDSHSRGQSNPAPVPMQMGRHQQMSLPTSSHSSPTSMASSNNRNKLQKPASARPLPTQPYPQDFTRRGSEPERSPISEAPPRQAIQRNPYRDHSPVTQRPPLSEYQVPANNSYTPRGSMYQDSYHQTSQQLPMQTGREYNPRNSNFYDDPLAAELSMIDIGPSRGQMVLSGRRGY